MCAGWGIRGVGRRDVAPALGNQGLDRRTVGQCELHRVALRQRLGEQFLRQRRAAVPLLLGPAELKLAAGELVRVGVRVVQGVVDTDQGAAGQESGREGDGRQTQGALHGLSFFAGAPDMPGMPGMAIEWLGGEAGNAAPLLGDSAPALPEPDASLA